MRTAFLACLLACGVLAAEGRAEHVRPRPKHSASNEILFAQEIQGTLYQAREDAWTDALDHARAAVIVFLRHQNPPLLDWTPSAADIRKLVRGEAKEIPEYNKEFGSMRRIQVLVEISSDDYKEMQAKARHARAGQRMLLLGKLLAALITVLASFAGYVRLDEWTKGYYTNRLRLATIALLGAAGCAWWTLLM